MRCRHNRQIYIHPPNITKSLAYEISQKYPEYNAATQNISQVYCDSR